MTKPKLLHELIEDLIDGMTFTVSFQSVTNNGGGTFTLNHVCDFHHAQPAFDVTIGGKTYTIVDYDYDAKTLIVKGIDNIVVKSFELTKPFFFHGTPLQTEVELIKTPLEDKTPMVYLLEPYPTEEDHSPSSSIAYTSTVTLCFLTQANVPKWLTDDFYHNAINPMRNLMEDVIAAIVDSPLFYSDTEQKSKPKFHTKFGIKLTDAGVKELTFSENLSGCSNEMKLSVYKVDCEECDC